MDTVDKCLRYLREMTHLKRSTIIREDGAPVAWVTFFIVNDLKEVDNIYHTNLWTTHEDSPTGEVIYIDKIVCTRKWVPEMRRKLQGMLLGLYPQLKTAVWHKADGDNDRLVVRPILQERRHAEIYS